MSSILAVLSALVGLPPFIGNGLKCTSNVFASGVKTTALRLMAYLEAVASKNPVDQLLSNKVTGPGVITLGLAGAPAAATGNDRYGEYAAIRIAATPGEDGKDSFTITIAGTYVGGRAFTLPDMKVDFEENSGDRASATIFIWEPTNGGPVLRPGRLTTTDRPTEELGNGAPAAATGERVTITVAGAPADMKVEATLLTVADSEYDRVVNEVNQACLKAAGGGA